MVLLIAKYRITQQYGPLTLLKTADHLLLEPGEYGPTEPAEQKNYLQQKQEQQLNNINLHAVNWGIDLLNKYTILSLIKRQATFQPIQQMLLITLLPQQNN